MRRILILLSIAGLIAGSYASYRSLALFRKGSITPQALTVSDLVAYGPGKNIHVKLSDARFGTGVIIRRTSKGADIAEAFMPVFPESQVDDPTAPFLVACKHNFASEQQLSEFMKQSSVSGVIVNGIISCDNAQRSIGTEFPDVDRTKLLVMDMDQKIPTSESAFLPVGLSAIAALTFALAFLNRKEGSDIGHGQANPRSAFRTETASGSWTEKLRLAVETDPNKARWVGLAFVAVAANLAKFCVLDVLEAASKHDSVAVEWRLVILMPLIFVLGSYMLVNGKLLPRSAAGTLTLAGWTILLGPIAMGFALLHWLNAELAKYGYYM